MATSKGPDKTGKAGPQGGEAPDIRDDELERRRRLLGETLASRNIGTREGKEGGKTGGAAGYGQAFRLSSEFIAGIVVGAGLGWVIDSLADTSPWGLIIFLLLGFCAGVLNVLRSAGLIAAAGIRSPGGDKESRNRN